MRILILITAMFLSSCATRTIYVTTPLDVPPRPEWVKVAPEALECLADETYIDIARSVKQRESHIETLEGVIRSTQAE